MAYMGIPRGRNKVLNTVRLVIINQNATNNAQIYYDSGFGNGQTGGTPTTITYNNTGWLQLFSAAAVTSNVNLVEIFDSTGFTARLGTGGSGSEVDLLLDLPGGNGQVPVRINSGTRISAKPIVDNTQLAVGAELTINFYD